MEEIQRFQTRNHSSAEVQTLPNLNKSLRNTEKQVDARWYKWIQMIARLQCKTKRCYKIIHMHNHTTKKTRPSMHMHLGSFLHITHQCLFLLQKHMHATVALQTFDTHFATLHTFRQPGGGGMVLVARIEWLQLLNQNRLTVAGRVVFLYRPASPRHMSKSGWYISKTRSSCYKNHVKEKINLLQKAIGKYKAKN